MKIAYLVSDQEPTLPFRTCKDKEKHRKKLRNSLMPNRVSLRTTAIAAKSNLDQLAECFDERTNGTDTSLTRIRRLVRMDSQDRSEWICKRAANALAVGAPRLQALP
jgi:hypothetical protein